MKSLVNSFNIPSSMSSGIDHFPALFDYLIQTVLNHLTLFLFYLQASSGKKIPKSFERTEQQPGIKLKGGYSFNTQ